MWLVYKGRIDHCAHQLRCQRGESAGDQYVVFIGDFQVAFEKTHKQH